MTEQQACETGKSLSCRFDWKIGESLGRHINNRSTLPRCKFTFSQSIRLVEVENAEKLYKYLMSW